MSDAYQVVRDFEAGLCEYTGAPYVVTTNSCTMALFLACERHQVERVEIPRHTYVSVPMSIIHAGGSVAFRDEDWRGVYQLKPYPIWDAARRFTSGMYTGGMMCVSFHAAKILGIEQGGAILHDDPYADVWLRRARFDGRTEAVHPADDTFDMMGWHCYMSPSVAAQGLLKLYSLPAHNADLPKDDYPDLSQAPAFR